MFNSISTIEAMFYTLLAVGFLAFIIWLCVKFKAARLSVLVIMLLGLYTGGAVSGLYVNSYYTSSGGIIGKLESIIMPNTAETTVTASDLQIKIDDVVLIKQADETYLASIKISDTFE
ncbi:MAG: hypothetical protein IJW36_00560, partial [Clostridia bacterium]|nr:hypothetical protein [Clostridia bacterium]